MMLRGGTEKKAVEYGVKYPTSPKTRLREKKKGSIINLFVLLENSRTLFAPVCICLPEHPVKNTQKLRSERKV